MIEPFELALVLVQAHLSMLDMMVVYMLVRHLLKEA